MRLQTDRVVARRHENGAVRRTEILYEKVAAFVPNTSVAARDLGLRIEAREVDLGKDVRLRIAASDDVVALFQGKDGSLQLARAVDDELCSHARASIDLGMHA